MEDNNMNNVNGEQQNTQQVVNNQPQQQYYNNQPQGQFYNYNQQPAPAINASQGNDSEGNGLGLPVAGMVIGVLSLFQFLLSLITHDKVKDLSTATLVLGIAFFVATCVLTIIGLVKMVNKKNMVGIICASVGLLAALIGMLVYFAGIPAA